MTYKFQVKLHSVGLIWAGEKRKNSPEELGVTNTRKEKRGGEREKTTTEERKREQ